MNANPYGVISHFIMVCCLHLGVMLCSSIVVNVHLYGIIRHKGWIYAPVILGCTFILST